MANAFVAAVEVVRTIDPPSPRAIMLGTVALSVCHIPVRLMSITSCHSFSDNSCDSPNAKIPALATTTSMWCKPGLDGTSHLVEFAHIAWHRDHSAARALDQLGGLEQVFAPDVEDPTVDDAMDALLAQNVLPTPWIEPCDVTEAVLYLASDAARYVTGVHLPVDAGAGIK